MTGVGIAGVAVAVDVGSSVGAEAITSGAGIGGGAVALGRSERKGGDCAGTARFAASALGLTFGLVAAAGCRGVGARGTDGVAGPLAAGGATLACGNVSATGVTVVSAAVTCSGMTTTRRSGTSIRRSIQGKPKPGSHPWPPKVMLNSKLWISSESSSAGIKRPSSGLTRPAVGARETAEGSRDVIRARVGVMLLGRIGGGQVMEHHAITVSSRAYCDC